jgi:hypothetical protein
MGDGLGGVYSQPAECVNWFCEMRKRIVKRDNSAVYLKLAPAAGTQVQAETVAIVRIDAKAGANTLPACSATAARFATIVHQTRSWIA